MNSNGWTKTYFIHLFTCWISTIKSLHIRKYARRLVSVLFCFHHSNRFFIWWGVLAGFLNGWSTPFKIHWSLNYPRCSRWYTCIEFTFNTFGDNFRDPSRLFNNAIFLNDFLNLCEFWEVCLNRFFSLYTPSHSFVL